MNGQCFALLVGINQYPPPTPSLRGCLHDVAAAATYLHRRFSSENDRLHILELTDGTATRMAVIDGFRHHLGQAGPGDVALFVFSGHGSQVTAPPELWTIEPDRCLETLVCVDSRTPGGSDLVDKELALLIHDLATRGAEVVVILDCCHSGTATRHSSEFAQVRGIPMDERPRPWASFLNAQAMSISRSTLLLPLLPRGRHILFAACEDREVAYEWRLDGLPRGGLSAFLFTSLDSMLILPTYRELFKATAAYMHSAGLAQSPQLEATHPPDIDRSFLGSSDPHTPATFTARYDPQRGWLIDGGALHGLLPYIDGEPTQLMLYPQGRASVWQHEPVAAVAVAHIIEVLPQVSRLAFDEPEPSRDTVFAAVPSGSPRLKLAVAVEGTSVRVELALRDLVVEHPALWLCPIESANVVLHGEAEAYALTWLDGHPISRHVGEPRPSLDAAIAKLEQIAHWRRVYLLQNPGYGLLTGDEVRIEVSHGQKRIWPDVAAPRLTYQLTDTRWRWPTIEVALIHQGMIPVYGALLALSDDHTVANLLPGGCMRLDPGARFNLRIGATISDTLWSIGVCESVSYLKLIMCTAPFDATLFEYALTSRSTAFVSSLPDLNQMRALMRLPDSDGSPDDWKTSEVAIVVVRPAEAY